MQPAAVRFRCVRAGLWRGTGRTATGQRYAVRVQRIGPRLWLALHRIDGELVSSSNSATLRLQRSLANAVTGTPWHA